MHLENNMDVFCLDKKDKISLYSFIPRKKASQISVRPFLQWKRAYHIRHSVLPLFYPWPLCSLFNIVSSTLKWSSLLSVPYLLLHGWAPAGFLRGFCRLAVSIGIVMEKGKAYQPGESLCQKLLCHPAGIWSKRSGKRWPWRPGESFCLKCSCTGKAIMQWR